MTPRELALALAVTTVVADAAKERKDELRAELQHALAALGADSARAELPDGTRVAKSAIVEPAAAAAVTNEAEFLAWVEQQRPDEVVRTVRESYRKAVLAKLVSAGGDACVDPDTGELVPGTTWRSRPAYVSTRFDKDGRDAVVDALRAGTLSLDLTAPAALPGGDA